MIKCVRRFFVVLLVSIPWLINSSVSYAAASSNYAIIAAGGIIGAAGMLLAISSGDKGGMGGDITNNLELYVGGNFTTAGTTKVNYTTKWNGLNWSTLKGGVGGAKVGSNTVYAIAAIPGQGVYFGGDFTTAGGDSGYNFIAKWDGLNWSKLGAGIDDFTFASSKVYAITSIDNNLYVGGYFDTIGNVKFYNIARWVDGAGWFPLNTSSDPSKAGLNGEVYALTSIGNDLYIGGAFTKANDGTTASYIAKWNGGWHDPTIPLFKSLNGKVRALTSIQGGSKLYLGGEFTAPSNYIVEWNLLTDNFVVTANGGLNGTVRTLVSIGTDLYAGGDFTATLDNTIILNHIAKWDGLSWSALIDSTYGNNGVDGSVYALAAIGTKLYVGGTFKTTKKTYYIAKWDTINKTWSQAYEELDGATYALLNGEGAIQE